jgi:hypothetical protein
MLRQDITAPIGNEGPAKDLRVSCLGERVQFPHKLAAGEYAVEVFVRPPEGDATYYLRVVV